MSMSEPTARPELKDSSKLRNIAKRNTQSTLLAYAVPVLMYSGFVVLAGYTATPYSVFVLIYAITAAYIVVSMWVIGRMRSFTYESGGPLLFSQLIYWLVSSHIWMFLLEEGRTFGLAFALFMLVYTFAYGTWIVAVILNALIVVGYLSVSYIAIHHYHQSGSMVRELLAIAAYLPVSIMVGRVGSKLAMRKRNMKRLLTKQEQTQKQLEETLKKLAKAASTDELTGLLNRREMNSQLTYEHQKLMRHKGRASIIILDLDHFKQINDTYGHGCGDHVLQTVANTLKDGFRSLDFVARWGGEEFLVLMPDTPISEAHQVAQRVLKSISLTLIAYEHHAMHVTSSAGIAELNGETDVKDALHQADECLYQAKEAGRNRVFCATCNEQQGKLS